MVTSLIQEAAEVHSPLDPTDHLNKTDKRLIHYILRFLTYYSPKIQSYTFEKHFYKVLTQLLINFLYIKIFNKKKKLK